MWTRCKSIIEFCVVMTLVVIVLSTTWLGLLICFAIASVLYVKDRAKQPVKTPPPPWQPK